MWVVVRGGLGNQMFQLAFATALEARFGVQPRFVDLSRHARVAREWSLGCFGVMPADVGPLTKVGLAGTVTLARKLQRTAGVTLDRVLIEDEAFAPARPPARAPRLVSGYWQGPGHFAGHEDAVRARLRFPGVPEQWQVLPPSDGRPLVALHVRRGDYANDPVARSVHLVCDADWYARAWSVLAKRIPAARPVVFSDDPDWARGNLQLPADAHFVLHDAARPPWIDMEQMSRCDHFVISNSSFSWWAAYLGQSDSTQVVAPAEWLRGKATASLRLCPQHWELL